MIRSQNFLVIATTLKDYILACREISLEKYPMDDLVYQMTTIYSSQFKTVTCLENLCGAEVLYKWKLEKALYYLY